MIEQYVEQVKLLVNVLPYVAKEDCFALKGGTAINLFIRDLPRLSVDIDLAYVGFEDRAIIAQRIKEIQDKLDESYYKIKNGEMSPYNLDITMLEEKDYKNSNFDGTFDEFKEEQIVSFVKKYVMAMKNNKRIPPSVFDFLKRTVQKNAIEPCEETRPKWLEKLENGMKMADDYTHNRAEAIVTDNRNFYIPAVIERCLSYIEEERAANTVRAPQVKTHWKTLFEKFREYKKQMKGPTDKILHKDFTCIETIFELIDNHSGKPPDLAFFKCSEV